MNKQAITTSRFLRAYKKLTLQHQSDVKNAMKILLTQYLYPNSLRVKRVQKARGVYEASLNMNIRLTFEYGDQESLIFRNVGEHDPVLKNP